MKLKILAFVLIFHSIIVAGDNSNRVKNFVEGADQFAANLYKELIKHRNENFVVCPISVQVVLALTAIGAKGKTLEELTTTLRIPQDVEEIDKTFEEITPHFNKTGNYTLVSANKIYVMNKLELNPDYENSATQYFRSEIESVNFLSQETIPEINSWVSQKTFGKIQDLIPPNSFNELTQLVLINTLYFKGAWDKGFNKSYTTERLFFTNESVKKKTEMMQITDTLKHSYNLKLEAHFLELPYKDSDISMTIAVPSNIDGIQLLEASIEEVLEPQVYGNRSVCLQMPKFTTTSSIELQNVLMGMGMKEAFGGFADFSGIVANGGRSLRIDEIFQKALIEVDEEGTTAAAATVEISRATPITVIADHPFIYYLKSESAGLLFVGRYMKPEETIN
ncbi:hypothetical protein RI129_002658 [Pyrocoelia pectoralis]|uniref:Serpin domain-containing protein n=1 Tax=Pyrocoelia pectoralis TaxID=417401 RepID=A0AAN7ZTH8_9COLE